MVFLAEAFTAPAMMRTLAKVGFNQSYTYFTWKNSALGADGVRRRAGTTERRRLLPAELLRQHARHPPRVPRRRAARPRSRRGSCSPRRCRPTYGIYSGFENFENVPVRAGQRGVPRLREVRGQAARARRAAAAARPARSTSSGARTRRCSASTTSRFLETENERLIAYAKRTRRRRRDRASSTSTRTQAQEGRGRRARRARPAAGLPGRATCSTGETFDWRLGRNYVPPRARAAQATSSLTLEPA